MHVLDPMKGHQYCLCNGAFVLYVPIIEASCFLQRDGVLYLNTTVFNNANDIKAIALNGF